MIEFKRLPKQEEISPKKEEVINNRKLHYINKREFRTEIYVYANCNRAENVNEVNPKSKLPTAAYIWKLGIVIDHINTVSLFYIFTFLFRNISSLAEEIGVCINEVCDTICVVK